MSIIILIGYFWLENVSSDAVLINILMMYVSFLVPPRFVDPDSDKKDFNVTEGGRIVLPCDVEGDPPLHFTWYKNESPISFTDYHYLILENGSLEIYTAEATDTGRYRCAVSNIAGDVEKTVTLFVRGEY